MAREDLLLAPESLDALLAGIEGLAPVFGPATAPGLERVRHLLERARVAESGGDRSAALAAITAAMERLAELAGALDPAEAAAMSAMTREFRVALRRGDEARAVESVERMRERSGAVPRRRGSDGL